MKVVLLAPNAAKPGNFYHFFGDFMRVAAGQLEIDLEIVDGTKEREVMLERGRAVLARATRPDYLLLVNYMNVGQELLAESATAGVRTFFVVESLGATDPLAKRARLAGQGCLGEIVPDDVEAGKMLAAILTDEARRRGLRGRDGKIKVGALAGEHTQAGNARFRGWLELQKERSDVALGRFGYGAWEEEPARTAALQMLRAAPDTNVVWSANDAMALGALAAARELGRRPGKDVLIGGVDLVDRALAEVAAGTLEVSIGGHLVDGARALILLYDHDPQRDLAPAARTTHLVAVRADQAPRYLRFMQGRAWHHVDFARFSRRRNPGATSGELSLEAIMPDA